MVTTGNVLSSSIAATPLSSILLIRADCHLLKLLFQTIHRMIVSLSILLGHHIIRELAPVSGIVKDCGLDTICSCFTNCKGKSSADSDLINVLVLDCLQANGMVSDFAISHADLSV